MAFVLDETSAGPKQPGFALDDEPQLNAAQELAEADRFQVDTSGISAALPPPIEPGITRVPLPPSGFVLDNKSNEDVILEFSGEVGEVFGRQAGADFVVAATSGLKTPTWDEFLFDEEERAKVPVLEKAKEFGGSALDAGKELADSFWRSIRRQAGIVMVGSNKEKFDLIVNDAKVAAESVMRNTVGLVGMGENLFGAVGDFFVDDVTEKQREYVRLLRNLSYQALSNDGLVIDPKTVDEDDLKVAEAFISPEVILTAGGGLLARSGRLGLAAQTVQRAPRVLAREVMKKSALVPAFGAQAVQTTIRGAREVAAKLQRAGKARVQKIKTGIKRAFVPEELVGLKIPPSVKQVVSIGALPLRVPFEVAMFTVKAGAAGAQAMARKVKTISASIANPNRQKRLLDRLHQDNGMALAGVASSLGGTQVGDFLFNVVVDGATAGTLAAAEATLAGQDVKGIGAAFGQGFGAGGLVGGVVGERGAGAITNLIDPQTGQLTSRSGGSFKIAQDQINANKTDILNNFDQSKKLNNLEPGIKAALGEAAEAGFLPRDVILASGKDFNDAAVLLSGADNITAENYSNAALYFPEDNIILLNADNELNGKAALDLMGHELGHVAVREIVNNDPSIVAREAKRFEDPNGREMEVDKSADLGTVKVNKDLSNFVDEYNKLAEQSGAPVIETFSQAMQEFYASQAGMAMASNTSAFSPAMPLWVQKTVHAMRGRLLRSTGTKVSDTSSASNAANTAANTATGRHIQQQLRLWQQEAKVLSKELGEVYESVTSPERVNTPEQAAAALDGDANVSGNVKVQPAARQSKPKPRELEDTAKEGTHTIERGLIRLIGLPGRVIDVWAQRYGVKDRPAMVTWLQDLVTDVGNKLSFTAYYKNLTGKDAGKTQYRSFVPTGRFSVRDVISKTKERINGVLFMEVRDLHAIDANLEIAKTKGLINDIEAGRREVAADLDTRELNPDHQLSDLTRGILGDKKKGEAPLTGDWKEFADSPDIKRTLREVEVEGLMGIGENALGATSLGQAGGQQGLLFGSPTNAKQKPLGNPQKAITRKVEFERDRSLSRDNTLIEDRAFNRIIADEDGILARHEAIKGKIVNTDDFRQHFIDDGYRGFNAAAVQEPASYLAKRYWTKQLQNPGELAVFTAGGSGAGKSKAIQGNVVLAAAEQQAAAVLDSNMSGMRSSMKKIKEAVDAGKMPVVHYVYREPLDAFRNGVVHRMLNNPEEGGRLVPSKIVAENHIGAWETANRIAEMGGVKVVFIDNSLGKGNAKIVTREALARKVKLPSLETLRAGMNGVALSMHQAGDITAAQLNGYLE